MFIGDSSNPNSITKTWAGLVSHYATQLSVTIYKIDSWIGNTLFIMLDGTTVQTYTFDATNGGTNDLCGNPTPIPDALNSNFNEVVVNMNITITHSASTLTLKMISNLNNGMGSWGIRNLNIVLLTCAASCLTCTNACT